MKSRWNGSGSIAIRKKGKNDLSADFRILPCIQHQRIQQPSLYNPVQFMDCIIDHWSNCNYCDECTGRNRRLCNRGTKHYLALVGRPGLNYAGQKKFHICKKSQCKRTWQTCKCSCLSCLPYFSFLLSQSVFLRILDGS